ncbi:MAG TPA: hydroxyacid dehydrogenase [Stellaceae bacterium]|nr:hydroxyacid dehydrogenase [Stellaceae bacterium]
MPPIPATNKKTLLLPTTMTQPGWDVVASREDVVGVRYAPGLPTAEFDALLADADAVGLSVTPFGEAELAAAPRLRVVARHGVGYDAVDVPALTRRGIPLMIVGTANSVTVAEHAMSMMLTLAKRGPAMAAMVREGRWGDKFADRPVELYEKVLLIIGFGRIGTRIAKRCLGMEMTVLVYDPYVAASAIRTAGCEPIGDLDAAVALADFITIHCPKTPETTRLFDARLLARMKSSSYLVNTARGGIVDEVALHEALAGGKLAGAGLDVFDREPAPLDNKLFKLPNVALTPHAAGGTREAGDRSGIATVHNLLSVLDGQPNRDNVVNKEVLDSPPGRKS